MRFCNTRFLGYDFFLEKVGLRHLNTVNLQFQNLGLDELTIHHTTRHSLTKTGVKPPPFGFDGGCVWNYDYQDRLRIQLFIHLFIYLFIFLLLFIFYLFIALLLFSAPETVFYDVSLISSFIIIIITDIRPARQGIALVDFSSKQPSATPQQWGASALATRRWRCCADRPVHRRYASVGLKRRLGTVSFSDGGTMRAQSRTRDRSQSVTISIDLSLYLDELDSRDGSV